MKTLTLTTLATTLTIILLSGCGSSSSSDTQPQVPQEPIVEYVAFDAPTISEADKTAYLHAVNSARATSQDCGVHGVMPPAPALEWSDSLYRASYEHSEDLIMSGVTLETFGHDGSGTDSDWTAQVLDLGRGSTPQERGANNKYSIYVGENLVELISGDNTVENAMKEWLNSDGHCQNLMKADYTHFGMGNVDNMWTQVFGA